MNDFKDPMSTEIEAGLLANEASQGEDRGSGTDGPMVEIELNDALEAVGLGPYHTRVTPMLPAHHNSGMDVARSPRQRRKLRRLGLFECC